MSDNHVVTTLEDRVMTLRMTRLDKKNALTQSMYTAMAEAIHSAATNPEVRVLVLAAHPECFCAGNDLADFINTPAEGNDSPVLVFMRALANFEKPVIAAASGIAVGIGVTMLLHCDLVYCGEKTKLNMPFVSLGICPEFASSYVLPRLMGHHRAAELVLLGEGFTAQTALQYGLVNALLPNDQVEAKAMEKAKQMAALAPQAVRTTKMLLKKWNQDTMKESIEIEGHHFMSMLKGPEAIESVTAFLQKRKPDYSKFA